MFKTRSVSLDQAVQQGQALAAVQLADGLCLDLTHALTGNAKVAAHLFQGAGTAIIQTKTQAQNLLLPLGQRTQNLNELFPKQRKGCRFRRYRKKRRSFPGASFPLSRKSGWCGRR